MISAGSFRVFVRCVRTRFTVDISTSVLLARQRPYRASALCERVYLVTHFNFRTEAAMSSSKIPKKKHPKRVPQEEASPPEGPTTESPTFEVTFNEADNPSKQKRARGTDLGGTNRIVRSTRSNSKAASSGASSFSREQRKAKTPARFRDSEDVTKSPKTKKVRAVSPSVTPAATDTDDSSPEPAAETKSPRRVSIPNLDSSSGDSGEDSENKTDGASNTTSAKPPLVPTSVSRGESATPSRPLTLSKPNPKTKTKPSAMRTKSWSESDISDAAKILVNIHSGCGNAAPPLLGWTNLFPQLAPVLEAYNALADLPAPIWSISSVPDAGLWASVVTFAKGIAIITRASPAAVSPAPSHAVESSPGRRSYGLVGLADNTVHLGKLMKGYLATLINRDRQRVMYPIVTAASVTHVWACQFSQCEDSAVFNSPTAVDEWLGDIDFARYPTTGAKVKAQLITGVIVDVWNWAPKQDLFDEVRLSKALNSLCIDLQDAYGKSCDILRPLRTFAKKELDLWMTEAVSEAQALRIPEAAVYKAAAKSVITALNKALARFYSDNTSQLQKWYKTARPANDGTGNLVLVHGWKESFIPKTTFNSILGLIRPIVTSSSIVSTGITGGAGRSSALRTPHADRSPAPAKPRSNTVHEGTPLRDSLKRFLDVPFAESAIRHPWIKSYTCNGKPICGAFLFNGKDACKTDCGLVHFDREGKIHKH